MAISNWQTKGASTPVVRWVALGIFALTIIVFIFDFPNLYNQGVAYIKNRSGFSIPEAKGKSEFVLGLDLRGGAHLVYEADASGIDTFEQRDAIDGVRDVIERRVNALGVSEPIVQTNKSGDSWRVIIELAGVTDVKKAIEAIGETPVLEFKEESDLPPRDLTQEEKDKLKEINKQENERAQLLLDKILKEGEQFENIAKENSQDHRTRDNGGLVGFVKEEGLFAPIVKAVKFLKEGEISSKIIENSEGLNIARLNSVDREGVEFGVSHILICHSKSVQGCSEERTKESAQTKAEEIYNMMLNDGRYINKAVFDEYAKKYSNEPDAINKGGDIGYFSRGQTAPSFEKAIIEAKLNILTKPIETEFGYHLAYKYDERPLTLYNISRILITKSSESDMFPQDEKWISTGLSGKQLERAQLQFEQNGSPIVGLKFNEQGKQLFADLTQRNVGKLIGIFLDGQPISIPTVSQPILGGEAVIQGNFTIDVAKKLAQRLNAGALPVPITLVSQSTVGATLGEKTLEKSIQAGIIGMILVVIFMILYYRLAGLISSFSLLLYSFLVLAVFKMIPVTLTAASIAGFVLSLGMAIDANILIFERMKEELRSGKSLEKSLEEGFSRAWFSIRASNVSSSITAVILIYLSTSVIKGFAITLLIGIAVSIFTAVTCTRYLMRLVIKYTKPRKIFYLGAKDK